MPSWIKWIGGMILIPLSVWGMDARVQQQMGTTVSAQYALEHIEYLEYAKKNRTLTQQEQRDLSYWKERLKRIRGGDK